MIWKQVIYPGNTGRWVDAGLLLGQRRRWWANIKPALSQCFVFAGSDSICIILFPYRVV